MGKCPACNGTGKSDAVWYGQKTGKKAKCQLCNGTGKSNAMNIFDLQVILLVENKKTGKGWIRSGQFYDATKAAQLGMKMESKGFRVAIQKGLQNPRVQIMGQPKTPSKRIFRVWVKEHDF